MCQGELDLLLAEKAKLVFLLQVRRNQINAFRTFVDYLRAESGETDLGDLRHVTCNGQWVTLLEDIDGWLGELNNQIDGIMAQYLAALDDVRCGEAGWEDRIALVERKRDDLKGLIENLYTGMRMRMETLCFWRDCLRPVAEGGG